MEVKAMDRLSPNALAHDGHLGHQVEHYTGSALECQPQIVKFVTI